MNPSYYANIPAPVRYEKRLKPLARMMYGEITALCNKEGFCWATNDYFAGLYDVTPETVSRWISSLKDFGFIDVRIDQKATHTRKIFLNTSIQKNQELLTKKSRAIDKNVKCTIYSINNTINTLGSALNFVLENYPIRFEQEFLMEYEKQFKSQDQFNAFLKDFNDEAEMKSKAFGSWLVAMLRKYARNWIKSKQGYKSLQQDEGLRRPELRKIG